MVVAVIPVLESDFVMINRGGAFFPAIEEVLFWFAAFDVLLES
jgi:hypothetical protein